MPRPPSQRGSDQPQNDPDVANDPVHTDRGDFLPHVYSSIHQIFEKLGKIDQKIDQLASDQKDLKTAVDKHQALVSRITYGFLGIVFFSTALWFVYENVVKEYFTIEAKAQKEEGATASDAAVK